MQTVNSRLKTCCQFERRSILFGSRLYFLKLEKDLMEDRIMVTRISMDV